MFWETIAALFLILASFYLWVLAAIAWGLLRGIIAFISASTAWLSDTPLDWAEIWLLPASFLFQALASAWSVPAAIWNWAKFEHPWWAVFIAVALLMVGAGSRSR